MEFKKFSALLFLMGNISSGLSLDKGIYHIFNLFDGSVLESRFELKPTDLGKNAVFTNNLKCGSGEQLWRVNFFGCTDCPNDKFQGYQLLNERNRNNEVSDSKPDSSSFLQGHFYELIPIADNGNNVFNIRSKEHNKCLVNWGNGRRIGWWSKCESWSTNQLWKFHRVA